MGKTALIFLSFQARAMDLILLIPISQIHPFLSPSLFTKTRSAHIKLCLTIGRGSATYKHFFGHNLFIGSASEKVSVFRAVMEVSNSIERHDDATNLWPLHLSSIHHALVSTNLASDPLPQNVKEAAAERRICDAFISSIFKCPK
jgi:hypothetical protein